MVCKSANVFQKEKTFSSLIRKLPNAALLPIDNCVVLITNKESVTTYLPNPTALLI
jgi:hypothetical protein